MCKKINEDKENELYLINFVSQKEHWQWLNISNNIDHFNLIKGNKIHITKTRKN